MRQHNLAGCVAHIGLAMPSAVAGVRGHALGPPVPRFCLAFNSDGEFDHQRGFATAGPGEKEDGEGWQEFLGRISSTRTANSSIIHFLKTSYVL